MAVSPVMLDGGYQAGCFKSLGLTPRTEYVAFLVEEDQGQRVRPRATIGRSCTPQEKKLLKKQFNAGDIDRVPCDVPDENRRSFLYVKK